jgi:putative membrane protein
MILNFLLLSLAVFGIAAIVPGIHLRSFKSAVATAAVYGLLNFILFRVLLFITFPLVALKYVTLGLFAIVLNAVLLVLTDKLLDGLKIDSFGAALLGGLGIGVANLLIGVIL